MKTKYVVTMKFMDDNGKFQDCLEEEVESEEAGREFISADMTKEEDEGIYEKALFLYTEVGSNPGYDGEIVVDYDKMEVCMERIQLYKAQKTIYAEG